MHSTNCEPLAMRILSVNGFYYDLPMELCSVVGDERLDQPKSRTYSQSR